MKELIAISIGFALFAATGARADEDLIAHLMSTDSTTLAQALHQVDVMPATDKRALVLDLIALLRKDPQSAEAAARALAHCGSDAKAAMPDLLEALRYDEATLTDVVGETLRKIGSDSIHPLIMMLDDRNFIVRQRAATILGSFGPDARKAALPIAHLVNDPQPSVQTAAQEALVKLGDPAISALAATLPDEDDNGRKATVELLARFGAPAAPALIEVVRKDPSPNVRVRAAEALTEIKPTNATIVQALVDNLKDVDDGVRTAAANALGEIGAGAKAAIGHLIVASHADQDAMTRQSSAQALEKIGKANKDSLPSFIQHLRNQDPEVRRDIVAAVGQADVPSDQALAILVIAMKDADADVRHHAVEAAGHYAGKDARALGILKSALLDAQPDIQTEGIRALGQATAAPDAAAQALSEALRAPSQVTRHEAIAALGKLGPAGVPVLLNEMKDSYTVLAEEAGQSIVQMGPAALPALEKAKTSTDPAIQKAAADLIALLAKPVAVEHPAARPHKHKAAGTAKPPTAPDAAPADTVAPKTTSPTSTK